uniref:Perivitellin-2 67 kDa subunit-like n=1 Tax=Saccoglossus kowalevskii TaxID=10224 RepID=A0ABM0MB85_SACKO|nr:PREDICTED: perivitellin-2 67 kDa subunit-like [Saccoglossus kowalevskii]
MLGYDCKIEKPNWFTRHVHLCYEWYPDGDGGQCGGGASRHLCADVNQYTAYYRDDTDGRGGGCQMRWGIAASVYDYWFSQVQICYQWYADGDGGQCGGGAARLLCAPLNSYTGYYRDDTDGRGGGCRMSWQLKVPVNSPDWMFDTQLCYRWYPDGDGGQCGGGVDRTLCAYANRWTTYYRDDTDGRSGGCRMQWGLFHTQ